MKTRLLNKPNFSTGFTQHHFFPHKKSSAGFTLIELLVVIAIIGVLSAIVMSNLNTARQRAMDAAVKSNLAGARAQAENFLSSNLDVYVSSPYVAASDVCNASGVAGGIRGIYNNAVQAAIATGLTAANVNNVISTAGAAGTVTCHVLPNPGTAWAIEAPLKAGGFYCVDSTGVGKTYGASVLIANDASC